MSTVEKILDVALPLIKHFEGFRSKPYLCSAGVPTIGYGSTFYLDGRKVGLKDESISKEVAHELLVNAVNTTFLPAVLTLCPTLENENQIAAILSWTYNLGTGALRSSTMRKRILAKDWESSVFELKKWNKANGKVNRGLVIRREQEALLFSTEINPE